MSIDLTPNNPTAHNARTFLEDLRQRGKKVVKGISLADQSVGVPYFPETSSGTAQHNSSITNMNRGDIALAVNARRQELADKGQESA